MQILNLALIASTVLAHFDLLKPQVRYANLDTMNDGPCGGSNTPAAQRSSFPIVGGTIEGQGYHRNSRTYYKLSLKTAPTTNEDFNLIMHPDTFAARSGPFKVGPLDLSSLAGVRNGVVGTIQVSTFDSHDWSYQCADVIFQGAAAPGPNPPAPGPNPPAPGPNPPAPGPNPPAPGPNVPARPSNSSTPTNGSTKATSTVTTTAAYQTSPILSSAYASAVPMILYGALVAMV
jgi:hypothetical protein